MDQQNFINALRGLYNERPFHQFDIELSSGAKLRVGHPDALAFMGQRAVLLTTDGLSHHLDGHRVARISTTEEGPDARAVGLKDNGHPG
jgi:hypothetical protein